MQKFNKGDVVKIGDLPMSMSHFPSGILAMIEGSYHDIYHRGAKDDYALVLLENMKEGIWRETSGTRISWYPESALSLVAKATYTVKFEVVV